MLEEQVWLWSYVWLSACYIIGLILVQACFFSKHICPKNKQAEWTSRLWSTITSHIYFIKHWGPVIEQHDNTSSSVFVMFGCRQCHQSMHFLSFCCKSHSMCLMCKVQWGSFSWDSAWTGTLCSWDGLDGIKTTQSPTNNNCIISMGYPHVYGILYSAELVSHLSSPYCISIAVSLYRWQLWRARSGNWQKQRTWKAKPALTIWSRNYMKSHKKPVAQSRLPVQQEPMHPNLRLNARFVLILFSYFWQEPSFVLRWKFTSM